MVIRLAVRDEFQFVSGVNGLHAEEEDTYVFERPGGVDLGANLAVIVHLEQLVHDVARQFVSALTEEQRSEAEARHRLVLVKQLDGADLVHLPPLRRTFRIKRISAQLPSAKLNQKTL